MAVFTGSTELAAWAIAGVLSKFKLWVNRIQVDE